MKRVILHIDMDAFFAAIEQREHPDYFGKPLIVGADPKQGKGRGVVSTCSYEARKFGIHSAMPISQAYRLCPHGIFVPPNGALYSQVSKDLFQLFHKFTDQVEPLSIDEAFLDVSGSLKLFGSAKSIGKRLKYLIYQTQALTASVGIAPNKFLAKIASDLEKPDGLVIVDESNVQEFLHPLPLHRLWGAGKKTIEKLNKENIFVVGDLAKIPQEILQQKFGKQGLHFYHLSRGIDDRPVVSHHDVKSVSNELTFSHDLEDLETLRETLLHLCEKVGFRMRQKKLHGRTIQLKLRYEGFETITRNKTLQDPTANTENIFKIIWELFEQNYDYIRKVRLVGVGISDFREKINKQISLFDESKKMMSELDEIEDLVRKRFGKNAINRAEGLGKSKGPDRWFE